MIMELSGLPDGVVGFEASGKLAAEDYRDVVLPAIEKALPQAVCGSSSSCVTSTV